MAKYFVCEKCLEEIYQVELKKIKVLYLWNIPE